MDKVDEILKLAYAHDAPSKEKLVKILENLIEDSESIDWLEKWRVIGFRNRNGSCSLWNQDDTLELLGESKKGIRDMFKNDRSI